jgi:hypothetical protein
MREIHGRLKLSYRHLGLGIYQVTLLDTSSFPGIICINTDKRFILSNEIYTVLIREDDCLTYFRMDDRFLHRLGMIQWELHNSVLEVLASNIDTITV